MQLQKKFRFRRNNWFLQQYQPLTAQEEQQENASAASAPAAQISHTMPMFTAVGDQPKTCAPRNS